MTTLENTHDPLVAQFIIYDEMREDLENRFPGRWVVLFDSSVIGDYDSFEQAESEALKKDLNILSCFIQKVGAEPPVVLSYGN